MKFLIILFTISSIFMANAMELDKNKLNQDLIEASHKGNPQEILQLIENGADIEAKDKSGRTVLMRAILKDHTEAAKLLIKNGADIHAKDNKGWTALIKAARWGLIESLKLLIENGADINTKSNNGKTALICTGDAVLTDNRQRCCELLVEAMKAQTEKPTLCFLFCCKKAKENNSPLACFPKDIVQLIAKKYCWHSTREEINKISNVEMKQHLLTKYFPEKNPSSPKTFSDKGNL